MSTLLHAGLGYQPLTIDRTVRLDTGGAVTVSDPETAFSGLLVAPHGSQATPTEVSPRTLPPWRMFVRGGRLAPSVTFKPGDRVRDPAGVTYEALGPGNPIRLGPMQVGQEVTVQRIDMLYPLTAAVSDLQGDFSVTVPVALWDPTGGEITLQHGAYVAPLAEAPIEWAADLQRQNAKLLVGTRVLHIESATVDYSAPRVALRLREKRK